MPVAHIFGYGSLICQSSRLITGSLTNARLCRVSGFSRSWSASANIFTAVGVNEVQFGETYGVLCTVDGNSSAEIRRFDEREEGYSRKLLDNDQVRVFNRDLSQQLEIDASDEVFVYVGSTRRKADEEMPILQSYVDVIMKGCIESGGVDFAKRFIKTTSDWDGFWLNDRSKPLYPRPEARWSEENAALVDCILIDCLGKELVESRKKVST